MSDVRLGTATGRAVLTAATLGSGMALLDGTVVNVALKTIGEDLDASLGELQWIVNGYLLALASLILIGGSLGDRFGRRRVFVVGTTWFAAASVLCGIAPSPEVLIAARVLQGVGGALLTPGSLAMIQGAFVREDRATAIGTWTGFTSIAAALGPFLGGLLVGYVSWRAIFLVNVPVAVATVVIARRAVPETRDPHASSRFDVPGALCAALALGGTTYALIEWGSPLAPWAVGVAVLAAAGFLLAEARVPEPMLQLGMFADRTFSAANLVTFLAYGALGTLTFFVTLELQTVSGLSPLAAGIAFLPMTVIMFFLAGRGGALAQRIGPRVPMTLGPVTMAGGVLLLLRIGRGTDTVGGYAADVLPGVVVFGLGLALLVAPLTATVLAAAPDEHAGIASGVNNAGARAGSLIAVAALPAVVGLRGGQYADPVALDAGYRAAIVVAAGLLVVGGMLAWLTIHPRVLDDAGPGSEPDVAPGATPEPLAGP